MLSKQTKFILALGIQLAIILGLFLSNQMIITSGAPVRIRSPQPVDPPSLLQGNYIALNYTISRINLSDISYSPHEEFERGDLIWATLAKEKDGEWWEAIALSRKKPTLSPGKVAIRGNVLYGGDTISITYGIEEYFIPQEFEDEATRLLSGRFIQERNRRVVVGTEVLVHSSGRARVKEVFIGGVALTDLMTGKASVEDIKTEEIPLPDLSPVTITYTPATIRAGTKISFDSGIQNSGEVGTSSFNIKWFVDGVQLGYGSHTGVSANTVVMEGNSQATWIATKGTHIITFLVDADNRVRESNETNNQTSLTITIKTP